MAPTHTEHSIHTTSSPTIYNANTNALAMAIRNCTNSSSPSSGMRIIYIGKEQQPINLAEMVSVNSHSWKKTVCFNNLVDSIDSVVNSHTVADIVAMVTNEIPIDSWAALQEAQSASKFIVESVLHPNFLDPVASLTSPGNEAKLGDPSDLISRQSDITYVRFSCTIHGSSVDDRVKTSRSYHFIFVYGYHSMLTMKHRVMWR